VTLRAAASTIRDGDNALEFQSDGTWTGDYRVGVDGVDLVVAALP
jgi:hypothetical protein